MKIESILSITKVAEIEVSENEYEQLSRNEKIEYVSALIRSFRENIKNHTEELEIYFKKSKIKLDDLETIEMGFSYWIEVVNQTLSPFINPDYIHECFFLGPVTDDLITEYGQKIDDEIPKDALLEYIGRIKEYLQDPPLKASILNKLKTNPEIVLFHLDELETNEESQEVVENFSEGIVVIAGERIKATHPFYKIAKLLEKHKAFSEETGINQLKIHSELNLPYQTARLNQWKKIKGKTNPIIEKLFHTNYKGIVWLKNNVKTI